MKSAYQIIRKPIITEKGLGVKETQDTLVFHVAAKATKTEVKEAVQQIFKVKVASVRTSNFPGKERRRGKFSGYRPDWKKAYVRLKGDKPGELVYDLGARLPVEALRLVPAQTNSVIAAAFLTREHGGAMVHAGSGVFYRLTEAGKELQSPPEPIARRTARFWIVRFDPDKAAIGQALPHLEVQWRPAELVFVARGDGPFRLAFGNRDAHSALQPIGNLIPGYEAHAEANLRVATASGLAERRPLGGHWPEWLSDVPPRKLALWLILVAAVALLGLMTWRLAAELRSKADSSR